MGSLASRTHRLSMFLLWLTFSMKCAECCAKVAEKFAAREIDQACVLVNNATETVWFQKLLTVASAVCFLAGRVKYLNSEGKPEHTPLQGQAVLYLGGSVASFAAEFSAFGTILTHHDRQHVR